MKPPYTITSDIINLIASISEELGAIRANFWDKPPLYLRKTSKIKTIHSSLGIEGNTLSEEQITAILDNKRVVGPQTDIREAINASQVYEKINMFDPFSSASFLQAHQLMMNGLVQTPGRYRKKAAGIMHGSHVAHIAPPAENIPTLMQSLFDYLRKDKDGALIKSCVFHYELEFIHPFEDGNGRMGRLWQTVILMQDFPLFEFIPFETLIRETQSDYYSALAASDKEGKSTPFIEYMLTVIYNSLQRDFAKPGHSLSAPERIRYFLEIENEEFSRKDYMNVFSAISTATASRDLKLGLELGLIKKTGTKNKTRYLKSLR